MNWVYRPNNDPQVQLKDLEDTLGIQNLRDVQLDTTALKLYLFTDTKKYYVTLTEVV